MSPKDFSAMTNDFTFNMHRQIAGSTKAEDNIFCSSKNIQDCLALLYPAARLATHESMLLACCFPENPTLALNCVGDINRALESDKDCTIRTANGLWAQNDFAFNEDYINLLKEKAGAQFKTCNYKEKANHKPIADEINGWVEGKTKNEAGEPMIRDLVNEGFFSIDSVLTLVSAISFLGKFRAKFPVEATKKQPFIARSGDRPDCMLMRNKGDYNYRSIDGGRNWSLPPVEMIDIPYAGETCLSIILPKKIGTLEDVEKGITNQSWQTLRTAGAVEDTILEIPKFKMTGDYDIGKPLKAMGMEVCFTDGADFRGMIVAETSEHKVGVKISKAVHKAFVDTTEKGTEAAAATAIGMVRCATSMMPKPPRTFRADHPFLFTIWHKPTGCILFMGRHNKPAGY